MEDHLLQQQQNVMVAMDLEAGFRFHPTDEELIRCYLAPKVLDRCFYASAIGEVDLNKCEPWDLPGKAKMGEKEWYFFCHKDRKYPTGMRTNRATNAGYWKATGKDKEIYFPLSVTASALIGMKKTLVFYKGRTPSGEKTNWVMHEYRLEGRMEYPPTNTTFNRSSSKDEWVVCRIFHKNSGIKKDMAPSYTMAGAMMNDVRINNPMSMPIQMPIPMPDMPMPIPMPDMPMPIPMPNIPMPTMGEQGFTLNSTACTLPLLMDASSLYGATAGATLSVVVPPASSYGELLHAGLSMDNKALSMNVGNFFVNNQTSVAVQVPTMFYQQQLQMQTGEEGFLTADPVSGPSSMVSLEDMARLNNNEQNNVAAADESATEISSSVDMAMNNMWKY